MKTCSVFCIVLLLFTLNMSAQRVETMGDGDDGVVSKFAPDDGFYCSNAGWFGFYTFGSDKSGFASVNSGQHGYYMHSSTDHGYYSSAAGIDGFYAKNAVGDGYVSENAGDDGFYSFNSGDDGFFSLDAGFYGFYSKNSYDDGFYSLDAGDDGFYSFNSGDDGFHSGNSIDDGIFTINSGGDAGYFSGDVTVIGALSKGSGTFKIDHPLDPENKLLYHSFVESPDMMNVYNGNIVLDHNGDAIVLLPSYFEVLNTEFRYQLTSIGAPGPNLYIAEEIHNLRFKISGGMPNSKVSWQVTGIRQDPYANQNRVQVEVDKSEEFKGQYLYPEAYGLPFEKSYDYIKIGRKTLAELESEDTKGKAKSE